VAFKWGLNPGVSIFSWNLNLEGSISLSFLLHLAGVVCLCGREQKLDKGSLLSTAYEGLLNTIHWWNQAPCQAMNPSCSDSSKKINTDNNWPCVSRWIAWAALGVSWLAWVSSFNKHIWSCTVPSKYYSTLQHSFCNVSRIRKQPKILKTKKMKQY